MATDHGVIPKECTNGGVLGGGRMVNPPAPGGRCRFESCPSAEFLFKSMKVELDNEILRGAVNDFGVSSQIDVAIEECAELINALMKFRRNRVGANDVVTEIADVQIMCAQLEYIFAGDSKLVDAERMRKMDRLRGRIESYRKEHNGA